MMILVSDTWTHLTLSCACKRRTAGNQAARYQEWWHHFNKCKNLGHGTQVYYYTILQCKILAPLIGGLFCSFSLALNVLPVGSWNDFGIFSANPLAHNIFLSCGVSSKLECDTVQSYDRTHLEFLCQSGFLMFLISSFTLKSSHVSIWAGNERTGNQVYIQIATARGLSLWFPMILFDSMMFSMGPLVSWQLRRQVSGVEVWPMWQEMTGTCPMVYHGVL